MTQEMSVVLASNRGPVSFLKRDDGTFDTKRGAGGLAGALDPVARRLGDRAVWIAAATSDADRDALHAGAADDIQSQLGYPLYLLDIEPEMYSRYYDVVSNRMLWFANHCLWDELGVMGFGDEEVAAWNDAYQPVNERFARAVAEVADPGGFVLFQDYHLSTAPKLLKDLRANETVFHFTHSSFCGPEGLDRLPSPIPRTVIEGLLGSDLLGFHVPPWAEGFLACCEEVGAKVDHDRQTVEHEGQLTWVRSYPIPIDAGDLRARAAEEPARRWAQRFTERADGPLIVRADRTEPSKNIVRGFEAFEHLLDRRKDLRGEARFIACLYPSRQTMDEYTSYTEQIEKVVGRVNERYPDSIELYLKDDFDRTLGALLVYDVLIVNSIMDGMNLVSKEGPAINENDGVLVLSRGAGSFSELGESAIEIADQRDVEATAEALEKALDLSGHRRRNLAKRLRERAAILKPEDWINAQLEDLSRVERGEEPIGLQPPHTAASS
jgi:trehalose 6-phosphate synthase